MSVASATARNGRPRPSRSSRSLSAQPGRPGCPVAVMRFGHVLSKHWRSRRDLQAQRVDMLSGFETAAKLRRPVKPAARKHQTGVGMVGQRLSESLHALHLPPDTSCSLCHRASASPHPSMPNRYLHPNPVPIRGLGKAEQQRAGVADVDDPGAGAGEGATAWIGQEAVLPCVHFVHLVAALPRCATLLPRVRSQRAFSLYDAGSPLAQ